MWFKGMIVEVQENKTFLEKGDHGLRCMLKVISCCLVQTSVGVFSQILPVLRHPIVHGDLASGTSCYKNKVAHTTDPQMSCFSQPQRLITIVIRIWWPGSEDNFNNVLWGIFPFVSVCWSYNQNVINWIFYKKEKFIFLNFWIPRHKRSFR